MTLKQCAILSVIMFLFAHTQAEAQSRRSPQETIFLGLNSEANRHGERYDAITEYQPLIEYDSEVKNPERVDHAWKQCKVWGAAGRSYAHAQKMDAFFVAYPEGGKGGFSTSTERAEIAISLMDRAKNSFKQQESWLLKCMQEQFNVKIKPFPK